MAVWWFALAALAAPEFERRDYQCLDGSRFVLKLSEQEAVVEFRDGRYRLPRRPSGIAVKYSSKAATLYLDGDFAAFAADDRPLPGCQRVKGK